MINRIRVLRAETKTSQTVLGKRARMSQTMLNHIENGKRTPSAGEQKRIAKALRATVEAVFPPQPDIEDDPPPRRKLTRNERLSGLADSGVDTWEEVQGGKMNHDPIGIGRWNIGAPEAPALTATDLRHLATYILSAAHQLQQGTIGPNAAGLLREWHKAAEPLRQYVNEFPGSCADVATKRAMGMLTAPQLAKDAAAMECEALFEQSERVHEQMADARWSEAASEVVADVIHAYHLALEQGQS